MSYIRRGSIKTILPFSDLIPYLVSFCQRSRRRGSSQEPAAASLPSEDLKYTFLPQNRNSWNPTVHPTSSCSSSPLCSRVVGRYCNHRHSENSNDAATNASCFLRKPPPDIISWLPRQVTAKVSVSQLPQKVFLIRQKSTQLNNHRNVQVVKQFNLDPKSGCSAVISKSTLLIMPRLLSFEPQGRKDFWKTS